MADYYPLIVRALRSVPEGDGDGRRVVYERARAALDAQLRSVEPPLSQAEFDRERLGLESAISEAETEFGGVGEGGREPDEPEHEPVAAALASNPRPVLRRGGKGRTGRVAAIVVVLLAIAGIAVAAWLMRDKPADEAALPARPAPAQDPPAETKLADRVGGPPAAARQPGPARQPTASSFQPISPTGQPLAPGGASPAEVAVSQRAILYEENPADPQQPKISLGRTVWRLDALNGGQGQPLETVVRANVDIPEARLSVAILIRRNTDTTLPASHTMDITFTTASDDPGRVVKDVAVPSMKTDETVRGVPLAGLPVPVKDNVFLIGLSDLAADIARNTDLILNRNWIDLPVRFASGQRAALAFEKGVSGERVLADAFRQWGQAR